jgi:hypothetical protein
LKSREVGDLKIFYHPTYPDYRQATAPFSWNFYIGLAGKGPESIMQDWATKGIVIEVFGMLDCWERTTFMGIRPLKMIRISYPTNEFPEGAATYEVIFPRARNEAVFPLLLLE